MSKLRQIFNGIKESPVKSAVYTLILWAAAANILFVLSDKILVSVFMLFISFGLIYPVVSLVIFYRLAKRHGLLWYFYAAVIAAVTAEYFLVSGFNAISPNIIVCTILCLVFGCGIGSCFADNDAIKAEKERRRMHKLGEDKPYTGILNSKPQEDQNRKRSKKQRRS